MGTNRVFTMAFKRDAAQLVLDGRYSVREAYETMGVGETAMRRWVKELQAEREATGIVVESGRTTGKQRVREMEAKMVGLLGMNRRGNCYDNAPMERFFRSYKSE